jgi:hypothetical protein
VPHEFARSAVIKAHQWRAQGERLSYTERAVIVKGWMNDATRLRHSYEQVISSHAPHELNPLS